MSLFIQDLSGKSLFRLKGEIDASGAVAGKIVDDLGGDSVTRRPDGQVKGSVGKRRGDERTTGIGLDGDLTTQRYLCPGIHGIDQDMGTGKRSSFGITDRAGECRARTHPQSDRFGLSGGDHGLFREVERWSQRESDHLIGSERTQAEGAVSLTRGLGDRR